MSFSDSTVPSNRFESEEFTRSVHALFDTAADAEKAQQDLIAAGIPEASITVQSSPSPGLDVSDVPEPGFWERMISLFVPDDDRQRFAEGLRRGGVAIEVKTDTANHDRVLDILDRDGAVDLDDREETWRSEGWTGYTGRDPLSDSGDPVAEEEPQYVRPSNATAGFSASTADHFPVGREAAPPIPSPGAVPSDMLEATQQGVTPPAVSNQTWSRDTSDGRTRVRTYRPVSINPDRPAQS